MERAQYQMTILLLLSDAEQLFLGYRGGGGGGGWGRTRFTYSAEEGVFFKTSACPRFCRRRVLFCTLVRSMGGGGDENPLTIHEIYAALTPSDSRSDFRVSCRHLLPLNRQRIIKSEVKIRVPVHPMSVF